MCEAILDVGYKTIKIREDLYDRLAVHIDKYGETMSDIVERILKEYEATHQKEPPLKLKAFMDLFEKVSEGGKNDVEERDFVYELVKTGNFIEDEATSYIKKAEQNGLIYEKSKGILEGIAMANEE